MSLRTTTLLLALLAPACGTTGDETFAYPAVASGPGPAAFMVGDWSVTLERADVAIGPLYLCATAAASPELCSVAIAELTEVATVDTLADKPQPLGEVAARPGDIRSAMLDYGISWFTTRTAPDALTELGHSARLVGEAVRGDMSVRFDARVDVTPPMRGSPALVGVHASADEPGPDSRLELTLNPQGWLFAVDFDDLAAAGPTHDIVAGDPDAPDLDAGERARRTAHAAISFAMTTQPPTFRWTTP